MRAIALILLCGCIAGASAAGGKSANGGKAAAHAADVTSTLAPSGGGSSGGGGHVGGTATGRLLYVDPRHAPPLDPQRKVTEQDCSLPIDPKGGNLKCK